MARVLVDELADDDILQIAEYIGVENHNQPSALQFIDDIYRKFDAYAHQPNMGDRATT